MYCFRFSLSARSPRSVLNRYLPAAAHDGVVDLATSGRQERDGAEHVFVHLRSAEATSRLAIEGPTFRPCEFIRMALVLHKRDGPDTTEIHEDDADTVTAADRYRAPRDDADVRKSRAGSNERVSRGVGSCPVELCGRVCPDGQPIEGDRQGRLARGASGKRAPGPRGGRILDRDAERIAPILFLLDPLALRILWFLGRSRAHDSD